MDYPPAPDPDGPAPDGWPPNRWDAYRVLADGGSYGDAAAASAVTRGTVSRWLKDWRANYGPDLFRDNRPDQHRFTDEDRRRGWVAAGERTGADWRAQRAVAAGNFGAAATAALHAVALAVESIVANPTRVAALEPREILALSRAASLLADRADRLDDVRDPNRHPINPTGGADDPLAGLDVAPDELGEIVGLALTVATAAPPPQPRSDVIDITEAAG